MDALKRPWAVGLGLTIVLAIASGLCKDEGLINTGIVLSILWPICGICTFFAVIILES